MGQYVGDRSFGAAQLGPERWDEPTILDQTLSEFDGTLGPIAAQWVVTECYDEYFNIYENSTLGSSPYALVSMHEPEDLTLASSYDLYLERYLEANVLKYTGINFNDFMQLPRDRGEAILKRCDEIASKEDTDVENLMNNLNNPKR